MEHGTEEAGRGRDHGCSGRFIGKERFLVTGVEKTFDVSGVIRFECSIGTGDERNGDVCHSGQPLTDLSNCFDYISSNITGWLE